MTRYITQVNTFCTELANYIYRTGRPSDSRVDIKFSLTDGRNHLDVSKMPDVEFGIKSVGSGFIKDSLLIACDRLSGGRLHFLELLPNDKVESSYPVDIFKMIKDSVNDPDLLGSHVIMVESDIEGWYEEIIGA